MQSSSKRSKRRSHRRAGRSSESRTPSLVAAGSTSPIPAGTSSPYGRIGSVVTPRCGCTRRDPTLQWIETVMTKPFLQLAAVGVAGFAVWKMASLFLLPLLMLAFKVALIVAFVMLAVWFFKRNDKPKDDATARSEEHTSELQSQSNLVCRLLLEKKKNITRH